MKWLVKVIGSMGILLGWAYAGPLAAADAPAVVDRVTIAEVGFSTPESVEYYADEDVYLVTNINGSPLAVDGNGFISKVKPDGTVVDLKWIDGTQAGVTLNAPKGAAIQGDILYIADINAVRLFQLPSGRQQASVRIPGSTFLNGITPGKGNFVYVTDSGLQAGDNGFAPSGTDAVYKVTADGTYEVVVKNKDMGRPNGIVLDGNDLVVVTFGSGQVYRIDPSGQRHEMPTPPAGTLDGVLVLRDGRLLVTSWAGSAIYMLGKDGTYTTLADHLESPADIGYDTQRHRVLVPLFQLNQVVLLTL